MFRKAAQQGFDKAQYKLGVCYYYGDGVEQNYEKAVEWYMKSANQGNSNAQNDLGYCYGKGYGVEQNMEKEVEWYTKAANQGHLTAQCNLGKCYRYGDGVKQDYEKAITWLEKSAKQGNESASNELRALLKSLETPVGDLDKSDNEHVDKKDKIKIETLDELFDNLFGKLDKSNKDE